MANDKDSINQGSTVFRVNSSNANNTLKDWDGRAQAYGSTQIKNIGDPNGGKANSEITSIPSPFARIDLVNTAFKEAAEWPESKDGLEGQSIYHKMVSDSLDVGELLFNIGRYEDKLDLLVWDKNKEMDALRKDGNKSHGIFGDTLKIYLDADAGAYHFDRMGCIFLLRYKGNNRKGLMDIIGATSPVTMFFSSANDLSYLSDDFQFGSDHPFDGHFQPLFKRDFGYQKYLYTFRAAYGQQQFAEDFASLNAYMEKSLLQLDKDKKDILGNITAKDDLSYGIISLDGYNVEILGTKYRMRRDTVSDVDSDFEIVSDLCKDSHRPLVLPVESGNTYNDFIYTTSHWPKENKAPFFDARPLNQRTLPGDDRLFPYLTLGDFLRNEIVRMPFKLNSDAYFDGNAEGLRNCSYLLPVTESFFNYFTVKDLLDKKIDGQPMLRTQQLAGDGVCVVLRIPVKKGFIEYRRNYYGAGAVVNAKENKGTIVDKIFGLGLMPDLKVDSNEGPHYIIGLFNDARQDSLVLECYEGTEKLKGIVGPVRRRDNTNVCSVESYVVTDRFDRIALTSNDCTGTVIPRMTDTSRTHKYTFAVDFGTTNTHIEYKVDDSSVPKAFEIAADEEQDRRLHTNYAELGYLDIAAAFEECLVPDRIGAGSVYCFPTRTVLAERQNINYLQPTFAIADANVEFGYGKLKNTNYNATKTDLKWSAGSGDAKRRVELFIEDLCILMRNKVLIGGGVLSSTKIVWFYPVSMVQAQYVRFSDIWKAQYHKYFNGPDENVVPISESVAPYYHFNFSEGAASCTLTVDIGGGTTDIYAVEDRNPRLISSFRFASNAIFGDGYNYNSDHNGYVAKYFDQYDKLLQQNVKALQEVQNGIAAEKDSADITSFWFSLSSNATVKDRNAAGVLDFLAKLKDDGRMKYPIILFYSLTMIYIAHLMKAAGLKMPLTIGFSGNGSKTLQVLSTDRSVLTEFIRKIFEMVYGAEYDRNNSLELKYDLENPKLATCQGGLANPAMQEYSSLKNQKKSLLGCDFETMTDNLAFGDINDTLCKKVSDLASLCLDSIFKLNSDNDDFFSNKFGADPAILKEVKEKCKMKLMEYTTAGLEKRRQMTVSENKDDGKIEETMFFYPFVGMLNSLAREINDIKQ